MLDIPHHLLTTATAIGGFPRYVKKQAFEHRLRLTSQAAAASVGASSLLRKRDRIVTINAVTLTIFGYFLAEALLLGGASLANRLQGTLRVAVNGGAILSAAGVAWICWLVRGASR